MSDTQIDDKAAKPRLVRYPSPDGSEENIPVVQFPSPNEMSEEDFHKHAAEAFPQLLAEFVGNNYPPEHNDGYVDKLVDHLLEGRLDQAKTYAEAWQGARSHR